MAPPLRHGFTLIELLVVIGLIATIALTGGLFTYHQTIRWQEVVRARDVVRSELARAQADTFLGTNDAPWGVAVSPQSVTRFKGSSYTSRDVTFDRTTTFSDSITITGPPEVTFLRPEGVPTAQTTITITDSSRQATISVNATGAISVE